MHFDISRFKGVSIRSFDIEELSGLDSMDAAARSVGPRRGDDDPGPTAFQFNVSHRNQLIAQSISKVNGEMVPRPYLDWQNWTLRTQEFILVAYTRVNDVTKKEMDSFIAGHFEEPAEASEHISSGSGSSSRGISEEQRSLQKAG